MPTPIIGLDHLQVDVPSLAAARDDYSQLLGFPPLWEGLIGEIETAIFRTSNVDLWLTESSVIQGLAGLCFRVDELERMRRRLERVGLAFSEGSPAPGVQIALSALQPNDKPDTLEMQETRGLVISFTDRRHLAANSGNAYPGSIMGLDHVVIRSNNTESTAFLLAAQLGLDMRMDMSREEWNARLSFFRCGDMTVEVFQSLSDDGGTATDRFYGLSWRIPDADTVHSRLTKQGLDVSDIRPGRRPGTRVMSLRSHTAGVATLLLEHSSR